jgi:hypothetical protein
MNTLNKRIELLFMKQDLDELTDQAQAMGISRSELIRSRALNPPSVSAQFTTSDYHELVSSAVRFLHGDVNRRQIELLTAFIFNRLAAREATPVGARQGAGTA